MNFHNLYLLMKYAKEYGHGEIRARGMSDTEHTICTFLFGHPGVSQDDVAATLRLDKTTVARALSTLEGKQMIARRQNPENRRKNLLYLTRTGRESIADVIGLYDRWLERVSACLSAEEQARFDAYCARLLERAKAPTEK